MDDRQSKMLLALRQITENVSAQSSLNEAIALLVVSIRNATGADCCSLYLIDELGEYLTLAGTDGLDKKAVGKARLRLGEGLVGSVGQKQELLDLADAPSDPKFKYLPEVGEDKFFSFLGVPIIYQGELLGVLVIQSREKRQFGAVEESFLVTLSAQMSSIIAVSRASKEEDTGCVRRYRGEQGTGGIAIAKAVVWQPDVLLSDVTIQHTNEPYVQQELFHQTVFQLQTEMDLNTLHMNESGQKEAAFGYMSGYGSLLDDPTFQDEVDTEILANGMTASSAVKIVAERRLADLEGEEMTKWLFCVAKNKIKNQRRKHYYQNEVSYTQYQKENRNEGEAAATAEIEERMVMQNCIQNLNPMDQRIFWGRAYGFSYKELSGFCKKSEQALQCQYSRAIKKLQGMMSQEISLTRA